MNREELIRRTHYSFFLETMLTTFYGRIDRILTFTQLLLGSAVFASFGNPVVIGAAVAVISALSFTWQPAKSALLCDIQAKKMKAILNICEQLDDDAFHREYMKAEEGDSPCVGALRDPALKRAYIVLANSEEARKIKLTPFQSLLAHFSGDRPKDE